jgi:hypothetical protein
MTRSRTKVRKRVPSKAFQELNDHAIPELGWGKVNIILTDSVNYPKPKFLEANYALMRTEELQRIDKWMFHLMMCYYDYPVSGGCVIYAERNTTREELRKRGKEPIE